MILNLDKEFTPIVGENILYESLLFSGGEPHIKILSEIPSDAEVTITHRINSFENFGLVCLAIDALKRMGVPRINLFIPYFPAARQDRIMVPGEPLSVKVYADILNMFQLHSVSVYDAHSEVTGAVLNNTKMISNHVFIQKIMRTLPADTLLVSPDGGALKKIYKVSEFIGGKDVIECSKSRDVRTGKLKGFKVYSDDLMNRDCIIIDDICDGGGTFLGLAEELKKKNCGKLYLAVSHGIFNKGLEAFESLFDHIFTTDSIRTIKHPLVTQIKLNDGLLS